MLTDIVDEAGGEAELTREEMLEKLLEKVDEEDLCDQIGDLYGVKYEDGLTLAKAWEALVTASTLKEKVAKMDLDEKGVVLEKGDIGKHAVSVLADAKADIDFGLHGRDTVVKIGARRGGEVRSETIGVSHFQATRNRGQGFVGDG